jgi:hypothetical protein
LEPIVIIFNNASSSDAFVKIYRYDKLIVFPEEFNFDLLKMLIKNYRKKHPFVENVNKYNLSSDYEGSYFDIPLPVKITSLTEHEITFLSKHELPYFSVLKFKVPCDAYLTIVPEIRELPHVPEFFHYMGFINGIVEKDKMELRQLVNYIVTAPKEELAELELSKVKAIWEKKNKKVLEQIRNKDLMPPPSEEEEVARLESKKEPPKVEIAKKRKLKGRSKI